MCLTSPTIEPAEWTPAGSNISSWGTVGRSWKLEPRLPALFCRAGLLPQCPLKEAQPEPFGGKASRPLPLLAWAPEEGLLGRCVWLWQLGNFFLTVLKGGRGGDGLELGPIWSKVGGAGSRCSQEGSMSPSALPSIQGRAKCPEEAVYYRQQCYQAVDVAVTWDAAEVSVRHTGKFCQTRITLD